MSRRFGHTAGARMTALVLTGLLGAGALTGCGGDGGGAHGAGHTGRASGEADAPRLTVSAAFLPEPVTTGMAAGFFTVHNSGGADTLTSVSSDFAARATLHTTRDGTMHEQHSFSVPAHGTLTFGRGGNHVMFEQLTHKPKVGETVRITLHFTRSGTVGVSVPVKPATYNPGTSSSPTSP